MGENGKRRVRVGTFEILFDSREVYRDGHRIPVQEQPFRVLELLLQHKGAIVTRDELQSLIWAADTFVSFDEGLNTAIRKLRVAFGDSAENPRFIETIPRRGYRFIAPVEVMDVASVPVESFAKLAGVNGTSRTTAADLSRDDGTTEVASTAQLGPISAPHLPRSGYGLTLTLMRFRWPVAAGLLAAGILALTFWFRAPLPVPKVIAYTPLTTDRQRKLDPLVTDGSRVYFTMPKKVGWTIAEVSASGGQTAAVASHFDDIQLADISPDGSELLIGQFGLGAAGPMSGDVPLYLLPLPTGLPTRVGDILAHDASWSPDGERIIYAHGNSLYVARRDGSEQRLLVTLPGRATWPRWSPDGRSLRFTMEDPKDHGSSLWEVSSHGANLHPLLPGWSTPPAECCGNWTPDGKYFVFTSRYKGSERMNIWVIREKAGLLRTGNSGPTQLTAGPSLMCCPVPSRDGKKLFAMQVATLGELVRYDTKSRHFLTYMSGISAMQLTFSKDGQWVAYISYPDASLWRSKVDGSERLRLTSPPMGALQPQWSGDGKQIAFGAWIPGKPFHVYTMSADGGIPKEVTRGPRDELFPNWSQDGNSIIFGNSPLDLRASPASAIYRLNLRTRQLTTLTGSEATWYPRLSPDNRYIAALSKVNHLVLFELKTRKWTELTRTSAFYPAWSHDGKYVYFSSTAEGQPAFYRVRVSNDRLERVASLKDVKRPTSASFGSWTGLAPDDSPLALGDVSTYDIYSLDWQLP